MGFRRDILKANYVASGGNECVFDCRCRTGGDKAGISNQQNTLGRAGAHKRGELAIDFRPKVDFLRNSKGEYLRHT